MWFRSLTSCRHEVGGSIEAPWIAVGDLIPIGPNSASASELDERYAWTARPPDSCLHSGRSNGYENRTCHRARLHGRRWRIHCAHGLRALAPAARDRGIQAESALEKSRLRWSRG